MLVHLGTLAVLARHVAPADFGVMSGAVIILTLATIAAEPGLLHALVQGRECRPAHLHTAFTVVFLLSLLLALLLWQGAPLAAAAVRIPAVATIMPALGVSLVIRAVALPADATLQRELRFRRLAAIELTSYAVGQLLVAIPLALSGAGVWALVGALLATALCRSVLLLVSCAGHIAFRISRSELRDLVAFGGGLTLARGANYVAENGDSLVIGRTLGAAALGYYGRAYALMMLPTTFMARALERVLFPTMARIQADLERLTAAYLRGILLMVTVVAPVSAFCIALAPQIVEVLLGPAWRASAAPFSILAAGMVLHASFRVGDMLVKATGQVYRRALRQSLYAAVVVAGSWYGVRWGISGAAWAVAAAIVVNAVLMLQLARDITRTSWLLLARAHLPGLLLGAAVGLAASGAAQVIDRATDSAVLVLAGAAGGALLACAGTVVSFRRLFLGPDFLWLLHTIRDVAAQPSPRTGDHA